jgi:hypothetical protein
MTKEKSVEEKDYETDGYDRKDKTRNEREEKKQYPDPKRNSRLWGRELAASALGTYAGTPRIDVQPGTEFDIITPPAEIAEERLADRYPIAVVTIFHKNEMGS